MTQQKREKSESDVESRDYLGSVLSMRGVIVVLMLIAEDDAGQMCVRWTRGESERGRDGMIALGGFVVLGQDGIHGRKLPENGQRYRA